MLKAEVIVTCPSCQKPNDAMSVKCIHCGTTLIHEARGHSKRYRSAEAGLNNRMFSLVCSVVGLLLGALLLNTVLAYKGYEPSVVYGVCALGCWALGRFWQWKNWDK